MTEMCAIYRYSFYLRPQFNLGTEHHLVDYREIDKMVDKPK